MRPRSVARAFTRLRVRVALLLIAGVAFQAVGFEALITSLTRRWLPLTCPAAAAWLSRALIASLAGSVPPCSPSLGHSGSPAAPRLHHRPPGVLGCQLRPLARGAGVSANTPHLCLHRRRLADRVVEGP